MEDIKTIIGDYSKQFNAKFAELFSYPEGPQKRVVEAMVYSLTNGGKRLRPFLVYEVANLFGISFEQSFRAAAALEMIHTYSLIHDDLPAMDNDELRRGKPTCHIKFDEATAIIAGDGLQAFAFEILSDEKTHTDANIRCKLIKQLANAAGAYDGMVAGQMLDLFTEDCSEEYKNENLVKKIEEMKTGRLIKFACEAGAILGNASEEKYNALMTYARNIGMAFQIADDILDIEGDPALVGKKLKKDKEQGKVTFVTLYGIEKARQMAGDLINEAISELTVFRAKANNLKLLAKYVIDRKY